MTQNRRNSNKKVKNKRLKFRFSEDLMLIERKRLGLLIYTRYVANVAAGGLYLYLVCADMWLGRRLLGSHITKLSEKQIP